MAPKAIRRASRPGLPHGAAGSHAPRRAPARQTATRCLHERGDRSARPCSAATACALLWRRTCGPSGYADVAGDGVARSPACCAWTAPWINDALMARCSSSSWELEVKREIHRRQPSRCPAAGACRCSPQWRAGRTGSWCIFAIAGGEAGAGARMGHPRRDRHRLCHGGDRPARHRASPQRPCGLFLLTVAIVDDIGAVLIIALFYAGELSLAVAARRRSPALAASSRCSRAGVARLGVLRRCSASRLWVCRATSPASTPRSPAWRSSAASTPTGAGRRTRRPGAPRARACTRVSAFAIVPLFALANARR